MFVSIADITQASSKYALGTHRRVALANEGQVNMSCISIDTRTVHVSIAGLL